MSTFWRWLTGSDPEAPRRARRPREGLRPELTTLEGRQLMAVTMGTTVQAGTIATNDIILPSATTLKKGTTLTDDIILPSGITLKRGTTPTSDIILPSGTTLTKGKLTVTAVLPPVQVSPKFLFPSDGRYVPVTISGGLNSVYVMNLVGPYAVFPKPASSARVLSQLPLPDPTSTTTPAVIKPISGTYSATLPGSKTPVIVPYTLLAYAPPTIQVVTGPNGQAVPEFTPGAARYTVTLPGFTNPANVTVGWQGSLETNKDGSFVKVNGQFVISPKGLYTVTVTSLPVSDFENSAINARLNARPGPVDAVLQVTDQYRQDEPRAVTPLTLVAAPILTPFGTPTFVKSTYNEKISLPTEVTILRQFSYSFSTHLQALKHPGTGGRQYIINVSSEDADDGGSVNAAAIVPADAPTIRR